MAEVVRSCDIDVCGPGEGDIGVGASIDAISLVAETQSAEPVSQPCDMLAPGYSCGRSSQYFLCHGGGVVDSAGHLD